MPMFAVRLTFDHTIYVHADDVSGARDAADNEVFSDENNAYDPSIDTCVELHPVDDAELLENVTTYEHVIDGRRA